MGGLIIRSALAEKTMKRYRKSFHTFMSFSSPHLGVDLNDGLIKNAIRIVSIWENSKSLDQIMVEASDDPYSSFLYNLSKSKVWEMFSNVVLLGSDKDKIVSSHSALVDICNTLYEES